MKPITNLFFFRLLVCKSLLWVFIFSVHFLWKKDCSFRVPFSQSTSEYTKPHLYKTIHSFGLNVNASHRFWVYICCSLQIPLQSKQNVLTFVALNFFCFVEWPTSITDLELIRCYVSLCKVPLDPKSKFMNMITIQ